MSGWIEVLDLGDPATAAEVLTLQRRAHEVEAELLGDRRIGGQP